MNWDNGTKTTPNSNLHPFLGESGVIKASFLSTLIGIVSLKPIPNPK